MNEKFLLVIMNWSSGTGHFACGGGLPGLRHRRAGDQSYRASQTPKLKFAEPVDARCSRRHRSASAAPRKDIFGISENVLRCATHLRWDHRDDPQTARLHDDDLVANDKEMVAAPCGIDLHDPRRERNVLHGPRHHGAHREREGDAGDARGIAHLHDRLTDLRPLLGADLRLGAATRLTGLTLLCAGLAVLRARLTLLPARLTLLCAGGLGVARQQAGLTG